MFINLLRDGKRVVAARQLHTEVRTMTLYFWSARVAGILAQANTAAVIKKKVEGLLSQLILY